MFHGRAPHVIPGGKDRKRLHKVVRRIGAEEPRPRELGNRQDLEARTVGEFLAPGPVLPAEHHPVLHHHVGFLRREVVPVLLGADRAVLIPADDHVQPGHLRRGQPDLPEGQRTTTGPEPVPDCRRRGNQDHRRQRQPQERKTEDGQRRTDHLATLSSVLCPLFSVPGLFECRQHLPSQALAMGRVRLGVDPQPADKFSEFIFILEHFHFSKSHGLGLPNAECHVWGPFQPMTTWPGWPCYCSTSPRRTSCSLRSVRCSVTRIVAGRVFTTRAISS